MGGSNGKRERDYQSEQKKRSEESELIFSKIPKDQYLCPYCDNIAELRNVHIGSGFLEFRCKKDGDIPIKVDTYLEKMTRANTYFREKCFKCNKRQIDCKEEILQYCFDCKKSYCKKHITSHDKSHQKVIPVNKKFNYCSFHSENNEYKKYCKDCKEHICGQLIGKNHKKHNTIDLYKLKINKEEKEIIAEKNKILRNIIKFNDIILDTYEKCPDNYLHYENVKNLAESIKNEDKSSEKFQSDYEKIEKKLNSQLIAIEDLNKKLEEFDMKINGKEEKLILKDKNLDDEFLNKLSKVFFECLKKLDLSGNIIKDIKCLKNMKLDGLEILNLSDNNVKDIEVFQDMDLNNLKELYLQNNKIEEIKVFLKTSLSKIKSIRMENNNIRMDLQHNKEVINKFKKVINTDALTIEDFNKKYECNISFKSKSIYFSDQLLGDSLIEDLSSINTKYDNLIKLEIRNNKIKNISHFSRKSFKNLKILDLSVNKIEEIDVLEEMNLENLEELFLSDNLIKNICPLKYFESKNLKQLDIKENQLNNNTFKEKNDEIIKILKKSKKLEIDL